MEKTSKRKKELDKLKEKQREISKKILEITERNQERINKKLVGKFFVTENSYGGGKEFWKLYTRVNGVFGSYLNCLRFEIDCNGKIYISPDDVLSAVTIERYKEISELEFSRAFSKLKQMVGDL